MNADVNWTRMRLFLKIGIVGAVSVLIGDFIMGWGVRDTGVGIIESQASPYLKLSDMRIVLSGLIGMICVPICCLGHYVIYKLLKPYSNKYSRLYGIGTMGFLTCGGAGVHMSSVQAAFFYKSMYEVDSFVALAYSERYVLYFLVPLYMVMMICWFMIVYAQLVSSLKGLSPYPKRSWVLSMAIPTILASMVGMIGNYALVNAIVMGAFSIGDIWTLVGHLRMLDEAKLTYERDLNK